MKHIKLFEQFVNAINEKKMLKKDLKKLADEIASQIPDLPAFKKFKKQKDSVGSLALSSLYPTRILPVTPALSKLGQYTISYGMTTRNKEYEWEFTANNSKLFGIAFPIDKKGGHLYGNGKTSYVSTFQLYIGQDSYTSEMPIYWENSDEMEFAEKRDLFHGMLNDALNSPGFVKLINQYADTLDAFNSQV